MPVPIDKALTMIQAGHAKALELDIAVSVSVVDEGGRLVAFGRMDRSRPMSVDISRSEEHTSELQSRTNLVCRLLLEKKKKNKQNKKKK